MKILNLNKTLYLLLLATIITACQNTSKQSDEKSTASLSENQSPELIKVLSEQLKRGEDENFKYREKDLDVTIPFLKKGIAEIRIQARYR